LQVDAICYNAFIQEQSLGIHYNEGGDLLDYVSEGTFVLKNGFLDIPSGPGLGIEVDEATVRERASSLHKWRPPLWRHKDGSVAEW
jgi:galactonate dehydratase